MTIIELITADQKLCTTTEPIVAAGDKKSVKLHVEFSNEWSGYAKAAVFFAGKNIDDIYEVVMTDNECIVPHEVLSEADNLFIGVRGVIASTGAVKTSTLVKYRIEEGAPTGTGTSVEPTADVYQQLLTAHSVMNARLNELVAQNPSGVPAITELTIEGTSYATCGSLKVISNGINALIDINNLLWISQTEKTWVTLVTFPESLRPMTTFEEGYADRLLFYFDDNDAAIKLGFRDNKLQMYVANATWAKQQSITCQLPYALKYPVIDELADIRVDANGVTHPTAGEAIRTQFQNIEAEIQEQTNNLHEQIDELADEGDNLSMLVLKHEALLTPSQDVMLSDVTMFGNAYIDLQMIEAGHQMTRGHITEQGDANEYADIRFVSKGLQIDISANEYIMGLSRDQLNRYGVVITDTSHVVQRTVFAFEMVENGGIYEMPEDGYAYVYMAYMNSSLPVYSIVNGIFGNGGNGGNGDGNITVDSALSQTSTNPVQNKVVTNKLREIQGSVGQLSEDKADKADTYTKAEVDEIVQNLPSGGSETWRTIREFEISNEEGITNDTSGITWTVDESGNITAFLIETDSNGNAFSASKLRYAIYPQAHDKAIFGGKKGYLTVSCNGYDSSIYNATAVIVGHRIQGNVECDMSGILRHIIYMGADRNSYGNERPHLNYFNSAGKGYTTPPITRFRVGCDSGIWFVQGAKVLVQICEEV